MSNVNKSQEEQLKANAEKAFAELPEENRDQAAAARSQLLNWLVTMNRVTQNPAELATDQLSNTACNALESVLTSQVDNASEEDKQKWQALLDAFNELSDDDQLNLQRFVLSSVFQKHARNAALMSRAHDLFLWENTGFHVDSGLKCMFAKLGRNPYQAIGFDDGEHYIGTEGSKTLWTREFCIALMIPWAPAFEVSKEELEPQKISDDYRVSDKEREKIMAVLAMFDEDIAKHSKLKDKEAIRDYEDRMREGIRLARIRVPRLDNKLDDLQDEHPEVGNNFENVDIVQLVVSCREFLQMKLDDDQVRREVSATVLAVGDMEDEQKRLISTLLDGISARIPPEGEAPDVDALTEAISESTTAFPELSEELAEYDDSSILEAAKTVAIWLQKKLD